MAKNKTKNVINMSVNDSMTYTEIKQLLTVTWRTDLPDGKDNFTQFAQQVSTLETWACDF